MTSSSSTSASSQVAKAKTSIELPRELQRLIWSFLPTFESMLMHFLTTNIPASLKTAVTANPPPVKKLRKGPSYVTHATSNMMLVEHIGNCKLMATMAQVPCSGNCHNAYSCLSPKVEVALHLFMEDKFVPMSKLHRPVQSNRSFVYTVVGCDHIIVKKLYTMIARDIPFIQHHMKLYLQFPSFQFIGEIWKQLFPSSTTNSSTGWYFSLYDSPHPTSRLFNNVHPTWAMDFMMNHFEGDEFFEDMLHKYALNVRVHKSTRNDELDILFGKEFVQRLRIGEAMMPSRQHLVERRDQKEYFDHAEHFLPAKFYAHSKGLPYPLPASDVTNLLVTHVFDDNDDNEDGDEDEDNLFDSDEEENMGLNAAAMQWAMMNNNDNSDEDDDDEDHDIFP